MIPPDPLLTLLATMSMTVALMGVFMSLAQTRDRRIFRVLAWFFAAIFVTELGDVFGHLFAFGALKLTLYASWIIGATSATPLLWLYIWMLTDPDQNWPPRIWLHAFIPALASVLFCTVFVLPTADQQLLFSTTDGDLSRAAFLFAVAYEGFAIFIITVQWLVYLILVARRLLRYRSQLRDVFASTEGKELRWVAVILSICGAYWLLGVVLLGLDIFGFVADSPDAPDYALNLLVNGILVIWGLRQRPGLRQDVSEPVTKYARSALTPEMARRISGKLIRAMTQDQLFLDPNLSLWALSKHVGVTDNYVSQVLNEEIGQNFFDFVNTYRVKEAQLRLASSDETILNIAYDIGFNSRSSFYTAFNKITGQTPTAFRKSAVLPG